MSEKENLLQYMEAPIETDAINRMGCSENWYNPYYCIANTFTKEEIAQMSDHEIDMLAKLAKTICEALY